MMCEDINQTANAVYTSEANGHRYSPLTLCLDWPATGRFAFLVAFSTAGSVMNGYFISTFFVDSELGIAGNVFHGCAGLCDLIITVMIMSTSFILLSDDWDKESVCNVFQGIAEFATYSYHIFFMMTAIQNFCKFCCPDKGKGFFRRNIVELLAIIIFSICFVTAAVGVILQLDYNYCTRPHFGNIYFRVGTAILFQAVPFAITVLCFFMICFKHRDVGCDKFFKHTTQFHVDYCDVIINIINYLFFVSGWTPYLVVVNKYPKSCDGIYYHTAWMGLLRSVFSSFWYAFLSDNFRRGFTRVIDYCCFKNKLQTSYSTRHRRGIKYTRRPRKLDVSVNLMHKAFVADNPSRFAYSSRRSQYV